MNVTKVYHTESGFLEVAICPVLSALSTVLGSVIGVYGNGDLYKIAFCS